MNHLKTYMKLKLGVEKVCRSRFHAEPFQCLHIIAIAITYLSENDRSSMR